MTAYVGINVQVFTDAETPLQVVDRIAAALRKEFGEDVFNVEIDEHSAACTAEWCGDGEHDEFEEVEQVVQ